MIFHLVGAADWAAADYRPASLDTEGFVHLSTAAQLLGTANRYYTGRTDLLVLAVDPNRLPDLRWEPPSSGADRAAEGLFPHSYTALPAESVLGVHPFPPGPDGRFTQIPAPLTR